MFKVGQKVVCIAPLAEGWWIGYNHSVIAGPHYKDIDVIRGFDDDGHLLFDRFGYNCGFNPKHFVLQDESFATEVLEQIKEQIEQEQLVLI